MDLDALAKKMPDLLAFKERVEKMLAENPVAQAAYSGQPVEASLIEKIEEALAVARGMPDLIHRVRNIQQAIPQFEALADDIAKVAADVTALRGQIAPLLDTKGTYPVGGTEGKTVLTGAPGAPAQQASPVVAETAPVAPMAPADTNG